MCGINGVFGQDTDAIERMNRATRHRGPDQEGIWETPEITLGANRLAIIDLSEAGRQPMTTSDGRFTIAFNGEIYNYRDLRKELAAAGAQFRGRSDTEVILEGYARWGRNVVDKLRGMWAFAVYDRKREELFLSRDHFGIKPLYLYNDGKIFAFSSEIKGLLAHPEVKREINPEAIRDLLLLGYILSPRTILRHTRSLLPGEEILIHVKGRKEISRINQLVYESRTPPSDEELLEILEDSVRHHLIADVPIGLFFSGGIDSTTLALILKRLGVGLKAYHVAIEGRVDSEYGEKIARLLNLDLKKIIFRSEEVPQFIDETWKIMDQPTADTSLLPTFLVSKFAAKDVKVVLSGEGGDELFGGYPRHRRLAGVTADLVSSGKRPNVTKFFREVLGAIPSLSPLLSKMQGALRMFYSRQNDAVGSYLAEAAFGTGIISDREAQWTIAERLSSREIPDGVLAIDRLVYLPDDLLGKIDTATMACSLEGRVPFLDREVFRALGAAPISWRRQGDVSKIPLKRILKKYLPSDLIERPKSGFSVPLSSYIFAHERGRLREAIAWYLDTFQGLEPTLDAILKWGMKKKSMAPLTGNLGYTLYALLSLYRWSTLRLHRRYEMEM